MITLLVTFNIHFNAHRGAIEKIAGGRLEKVKVQKNCFIPHGFVFPDIIPQLFRPMK